MTRLVLVGLIAVATLATGCNSPTPRKRPVEPAPTVPWQESFVEWLVRRRSFPPAYVLTVREYNIYYTAYQNQQKDMEKRIEWANRSGEREETYKGTTLTQWITLSYDTDLDTKIGALRALSRMNSSIAKARAREILLSTDETHTVKIAALMSARTGLEHRAQLRHIPATDDELVGVILRLFQEYSLEHEWYLLHNLWGDICFLRSAARPLLPELERLREYYDAPGRAYVGIIVGVEEVALADDDLIREIDMLIEAISSDTECDFTD